MKNKTKGKFTMRKRLKNILLACFMATAMVVGTAPSMAYAEDSVGGGQRLLQFLKKKKYKGI